MLNELRQDRAGDARGYKCPSTVKGGDLCLIGNLPGVAVDSYNPNTGGTVFRFSGTHALPVIAASQLSPLVGATLKQGDIIGAEGGVYDPTTNVTTGCTLLLLTVPTYGSAVPVGTYDDTNPLTSGNYSLTVPVKLRETAF
jgi:predicted RecA/RadA family phage recombinase